MKNKTLDRCLKTAIVLGAIVIILMVVEMKYHPRQLLGDLRANATVEMPARLYAIQWLSGLTDFGSRPAATGLAAITAPKNGEMIEVIGFFWPASPNSFEVRVQDSVETRRLVALGRKDHKILATFEKNQPQPLVERKYLIRGKWQYSPDGGRPFRGIFLEVVSIQPDES